MASTFTDLGIEIMATGENAGTWGDKTNTNLNIVNTAIAGYVEQSIAGSADTTALTITDGAATSVLQNAVIKFTGTISGNQIVTIPDSIEKTYIIINGTSGAHTVQFKTVSGTGVTFAVSDKGTKLVFSDGTNIVDAGLGGGNDLDGEELILDANGNTSITADTDDQIDIKIAGADDFRFTANTFTALSGSTFVGNLTGNASGTAATVTTAAQSNITSLGTLTTLTVDDITINGSTISDAGDFTLDVEGDIILDANGADIFLKDAGTTYGSLTNSSGNLIVKSGTTTALTFSGANVTVAGDLTVSGDDITMGTNTDGNLLVADGTNFNSIAVSSLSEISTAASDDVFLAIDTSGGGLKKIARSTVVAGLATDSALANIVEDTSPQLGGNLDTNSQNILIDDAHFIADESGNEQIIFQTTGSAVNQFDVTNAASGSAPQLSTTGDDSNIDLNLAPKGTGHVTVVGNTNPGSIQFNCEANTHGQILKAQPHSASSSAVLTLPTATGTLIGTGDTGTATLASLDIDGGTDIGADIVDADLFIVDDGANGTNRKTTAARLKTYIGSSAAADDISIGDAAVLLTTSSGNITIDAAANDSDIILKGTDGGADTTFLTIDGSAAGAATFNDKVIATELDISGNCDIDGTTNLDAVDIDGAVQLDATLTIGANDQGYDVILHGDTASANMTWDTSADDLIFNGGAGLIVPDGQFTLGSTAVTSTAAELNLLDGVSGLVKADLTKLAAVDSTAAELNIVDGGTSATSTTVVDADRVVFNDAGTMVQVAMSDIKTYMGAESNTPSFFARGSAATSVAHATLAKIACRDEIVDNGGCYNATSSSATLNSLTAPADCFTPNVAGLYYFTGAIQLNTTTFNVGLVNNIGGTGGSETYAALVYRKSDTANGMVIVSGFANMNGTGNNICLAGYQESGGSINTNDSFYTTYFGGFLVKAA